MHAALCSTIFVGFAACSDDEAFGPRRQAVAGDAGQVGDAGTGGDDSGGAGVSSGANGKGGSSSGRGGRGGGSGRGGSGGTGESGGPSDAGDGGGGTGGSGGSGGARLEICVRLLAASTLARDVAFAYELEFIADCRVNGFTSLYFDDCVGLNERDQFLNRLVFWNLDLWGCTQSAPSSFALVHGPAALTRADAQALIDAYLEPATDLLSLSPSEIETMRAALGSLSDPLVEAESDDYSRSTCSGGVGGCGGAGGDESGAGAAGIEEGT